MTWHAEYDPADYETATHAIGPEVYEWLERNQHLDGPLMHKGYTVDRAVRRWRAGEYPSFGTLDRLLLDGFDVMVRDLPDEVWVTRRYVGDKKVAA